MRRIFRIVLWLFIFAAVFQIYVLNSNLIDIYSYRDKFIQNVDYIPKEMTNPHLATDFNLIYADYIWFKSLQYYGDRKEKKADVLYLNNIFNSITNLDPYFEQSYSFGATLIGTDGNNWEECQKLLKKGMINIPDSWRMPFFLGFFSYIWYKNYNAAEYWFRVAIKKPDCPEKISHFIPFMHLKMGDYYTGMLLWIEIYNNAQNDREREGALNNIKNYAKIYLTKAHRKYREDYGYVPENLRTLINEQYVKGIPTLPDKSIFYYNRKKDSVLVYKKE